jgi:DNA-binding IscR family transcriptional regulator
LGNWTLFSNHGHVLLFLANDPQARLRDVAERVGITERAVQKIVRDLQDGGLLNVTKRGRRNRYLINTRKALRHPLEAHRTVGNLVSLMRDGPRKGRQSRTDTAAADATLARPAASAQRSASERVPAAAPKADSKPESLPQPPPAVTVTQPASKPAAKPAAKPATKPNAGSAPAKRKRKGKKRPPSDEQQGSLF